MYRYTGPTSREQRSLIGAQAQVIVFRSRALSTGLSPPPFTFDFKPLVFGYQPPGFTVVVGGRRDNDGDDRERKKEEMSKPEKKLGQVKGAGGLADSNKPSFMNQPDCHFHNIHTQFGQTCDCAAPDKSGSDFCPINVT